MGEINWRCVEPTACLKGDIMFKPGQKVVCINTRVIHRMSPYNQSLSRLVLYKEYTVVSYNVGSVVLAEVKSDHPEGAYYPTRFVPLEDWQQAETMVEVLKEDLELVEVCKKSL